MSTTETPEVGAVLAELSLCLTPGLGPVLSGRLVDRLGSAERACHASEAELLAVAGIGRGRAAAIRAGLAKARRDAERELAQAETMGVAVVTISEARYPRLLRHIPDPPRVLYVRGSLPGWAGDAAGVGDGSSGSGHWPGVGIVGTRRCTAYGIEQAERFAAALAGAGIVVVSGGARGIDTAAHRASLRVRGGTVAVLGCGLKHDYPPENRDLFARIAAEGGAVVSELPLDTPPAAENFPARNRIISGFSLGVLVIEAPLRSGSLITARQASEEQGREVMVVPGRVDSPASAGSLELIRDGAALVTSPADVIAALESLARHAHAGTHEGFMGVDAASVEPKTLTQRSVADRSLADLEDAALGSEADAEAGEPAAAAGDGAVDERSLILQACSSTSDADTIARQTGIAAHRVRAQLTMLELAGRVKRQGTRFMVVRRG